MRRIVTVLIVTGAVACGQTGTPAATPPEATKPAAAVVTNTATTPIAVPATSTAPPIATPTPILPPVDEESMEEEPTAPQRVRVTGVGADGLNLRTEPSGSAERLKLIPDGTELEIVGDDQEVDGITWRNVKDPEDGATGWVAAEFVEAADDASPPDPTDSADNDEP
jgi:hypothetical protein